MKSKLELKIDNTNPKIIGVTDVSIYNPDINICEPYLVIQAPGFGTPYSMDVSPGRFHSVNSNTLGMTRASNEQTLVVLPDGFWAIKYSIQPHVEMYKEYYFYRTTSLRCDYYNALLSIDINTCDNFKNDISEDIEQLMLADFHIKAAEANINDQYHNLDMSNKHYNKAKKIISKFLDPC
jgi:hypothetical protein